ncbi:nuclear transport factor 2 family protein [Streptomyces sp. NPDC058464]|uniref:nuclear transport factor 2 family protein n=1 Tax=Streptomyces sp. NPDC058464 TaxID=3346511 RepID=UPI00365FD2F7
MSLHNDRVDPVMTRADYERYLRLFMESDPAWKEYYAPGAAMEFPTPDGSTMLLQGVEAIDAAFKSIHEIMSESPELIWFVADEHAVAAKIQSTFAVKRDADYMGVSVKKGQVMRQQGVIHYTMENGRIKRVSMGGNFQPGDFEQPAE